MTPTTNLGLPIYGSNDVPQWTDTNTPFQTLDDLVVSGMTALLDTNNAVTVTNNMVTTADGACVMSAMANTDTIYTLAVDGVGVLGVTRNLREVKWVYGIKKGSTLTISGTADQWSTIVFVPYKYQAVDPVINVYNEAEVILDYAHPLFTFGSNNLSYTATKKCYVTGTIPGKYDGNITLSIDGTIVYQATYSNNVGQGKSIPILTIEKGSTVSLNAWAGSINPLHVYEGTVSGSVGALHSDIPDYSNNITTLTYNGGTYTATQECIVEIGFAPPSSTLGTISVNSKIVGCCYSGASGFTTTNKTIHLQKGDILTWGNASQTTFYGNVFGLL